MFQYERGRMEHGPVEIEAEAYTEEGYIGGFPDHVHQELLQRAGH